MNRDHTPRPGTVGADSFGEALADAEEVDRTEVVSKLELRDVAEVDHRLDRPESAA